MSKTAEKDLELRENIQVIAILLVTALIMLLSILVINKSKEISNKSKYINALEQKIEKLEIENWNLVYELDSIKQEENE